MSEVFEQLFYRPIVFNEIERTVWPPSWLGHTPFALWLMDELRPGRIVELGTHSGNSFCALCQGAALIGYEPDAVAIDTWKGDPHAGNYSETVYSELSEYVAALYGKFPRLLRSTFEEALDSFSDGSIDLLNIDGYHTYEATADNFNSWLPKLSNRGVVLIHDIAEKRDDFGVWKFWAEIQSRFPTFSFLHSHGLGVVCVGSEITPGMTWLTDRARSDYEIGRIRFHFSTLGNSAIVRSNIVNQIVLGNRISAIEDAISSGLVVSELSKRNSEIATELNRQIDRISAIESLHTRTSAIEEELSRQIERITTLSRIRNG